MPTTMLTPLAKGKARPVGASLWRRQLLPIGEINYEGRKIAFTKDYLAGLVKAFAAKAYDVVPFQFADAENKHTNRPEQRRGTVKALELTDDGLDILIEAGPIAAAHLREYPDLGVSASIVEAAPRADGRFFPAAIKHVLGTLDPRITGMRQWQSVEASNPAAGLWECVDFTADEGEILNLTSYDYAGAAEQAPGAPQAPAQTVTDQTPAASPAQGTEEPDMALTDAQQARLDKLLGLPDEQFEALITPAAEVTDETGDGDTELTDAELEELLASVDAEDATVTEPELETAGASLSAEAQDAIDLANAQAAEASQEVASMRRQLDLAAYSAERDAYTRKGIPVRLIEMARPLLEGSGRTVDLSNGKTADAGAIVRKLLGEFAGTMKELGISVELGTPLDGSEETARAAEEAKVTERGELVSAYRAQTGI